jgi:thiamine biosynthesis lipoprotein
VEHRDTFPCFGSECSVIVCGSPPEEAAAAVAMARRQLLVWHQQFSRFEHDSQLSILNRDAREVVPVSPLMRRMVETGLRAARATDGLVDPTLVPEIERAGYGSHFEGDGLPLTATLKLAPRRAPGGPHPAARWRTIAVDRRTGTVTRPPGTRLDLGGIAKGVFADELGVLLAGAEAVVVDCAGDIRLAGRGAVVRDVRVASPFEDRILHTFRLSSGGVATSGIGKRSWLGIDGRPAHHLLDPRTGRPAFTGVVQATALAPTATEAEVLSKTAVLSGPGGAGRVLVHGGVVVLDDGSWRVIEPALAAAA